MSPAMYPTNLQAPMVRDPDTARMVLVLSVAPNPQGFRYVTAIEPCDGKPRCNGQMAPFRIGVDRLWI